MAEASSIEWTDATWNPITGCSVVSPGCTNCYAMRLAGTRLKHHPSRAGLTTPSKAGPVWTGEVRLNSEWLDQPLRWRRPHRIFVCAHGDLFHESVPDAWIDQVFAVMIWAHWHQFQLLTKRSERMRSYVTGLRKRLHDVLRQAEEVTGHRFEGAPEHWPKWPLPNVWCGVSVEDQPRGARIFDLVATPAAVRWISAEPLLGPTDFAWAMARNPIEIAAAFLRHARFSPGLETLRRIDWVVVGGENGPRPMHPDWARKIRDDCAAGGVPFFFKQWGSFRGQLDPLVAYPRASLRWVRDDGRVARTDEVEEIEAREGSQNWKIIAKVGKHAAGRMLDGVEHNGMPEVR